MTDEYQPRTRERLIEILRAHGENPRSWRAEAADALEIAPALPTEEQIARAIATELGEEFEALPEGPHFEPEFTQDDFLSAARAVLALLQAHHAITSG